MSSIEWHKAFEPVTKQLWLDKIKADHKGSLPEGILNNRLTDQVDVDAFYTRDDLSSFNHLQPHSPFSQAISPASPDWEICFPIDLARGIQENARTIRRALQSGATSLVFESSNGEDASSADLAHLFTSIPLKSTPVHFLVDPELADILLHRLKDWTDLKGSIRLASNKRPEISSTAHLDNNYLDSERTGLKTWFIDLDECGDQVVTELSEILRYTIDVLGPLASTDEFLHAAKALQIHIEVGPDFYLEVSRLRALRYLLSRIFREHGLQLNLLPPLSILAETSSTTVSAKPSYDNLYMTTTMAMSAILGGATSLITRPFDHHSSELSLEGIRTALNTQLILKHEAHLNHVVDPGGGSYYIEAITNQLIYKAWQLHEK